MPSKLGMGIDSHDRQEFLDFAGIVYGVARIRKRPGR